MQLHVSNILTADRTYLHYYCSHYLAASIGHDPISHSIIQLKQSKEPHLTNWIDAALTSIAESNPAQLPQPDIIVRALYHDETSIPSNYNHNTTPLDRLGNAIAIALKAEYRPQILQKRSITIPLHHLNRSGRKQQSANTYQITPTANLLNVKILLIDDILTTGSTAAAILQTLAKAGADPIGAFTLAKAILE